MAHMLGMLVDLRKALGCPSLALLSADVEATMSLFSVLFVSCSETLGWNTC